MGAIDLSCHRVPGGEAFYIPEFITPDEEDYLIRKISESTPQKWRQLANRRLQLWGGEITSSGVLFPQAMPTFLTVYPDIITRLKNTGAFASSPHGAPNHVILNEYLPGQGIMPHEDGPTYYPVVATISLGSHSVFHYYRYNKPVPHSTNSSMLVLTEGGRTINPNPVLSLILERRSLVISTGSIYVSHLHGIREVSEDHITPGNSTNPPIIADLGVKIANWQMITDQEVRRVMEEGGILQRGIRHSLTCRDVERVSRAKSFVH